jgi:Concanavalin A-like lectin/glucanases superfamily
MALVDNLIARWCPSLETPSLAVPERVAGVRNAALVNMDLTNWVSSGGGLSLEFNGTDENCLVSNSPFVSLNADQTIAMWIWRNNATRQAIYCERASANYINKIEIRNDNSSICATVRDDAGNLGQFDGGTVSNNTWTHVALVRSAGTMSLVVNGGTPVVSSFGGSVVTSNNSTVCWIGGDPFDAGAYFNGRLDDICLFNVAATGPDLTLLASARGVFLGTPTLTGIKPSRRIANIT